MVTASDDNTARVWIGATGQVIARLEGHDRTVHGAAFSPDGANSNTGQQDFLRRSQPPAQNRKLQSLNIGNVDSASDAIDLIVTQGEGTTQSPFDSETEAMAIEL